MNTTIHSVGAPAIHAPLSREPSFPGAVAARDPVQPHGAAPAVASPPPVFSTDAADQVARQINDFLRLSSAANVQVSVDHESGEVVMRVVDSETHEVLRQIPSAEMLAISQSIGKSIDQMKGLLLRQTAG